MTSFESPKLVARIERWPIAGSFTISRGAKTEAVTVVAELSHGSHIGRGECVPYPRYGETPEATLAALTSMLEPVARGLDRQGARRQHNLGRQAIRPHTDFIHEWFLCENRRPSLGACESQAHCLRSGYGRGAAGNQGIGTVVSRLDRLRVGQYFFGFRKTFNQGNDNGVWNLMTASE